MRFSRSAGILLHPTSLAGPFGIGDLGPVAYGFADKLRNAGQTYWQILPIGPTGYGDSPYSSYSAFAGNTLLISPEKLAEDELICLDEVDAAGEFSSGRVNYEAVSKMKAAMLASAFERYKEGPDPSLVSAFEHFCDDEKGWLDDFALFCAIRKTQNDRPWLEWPIKFRSRDTRTLRIANQQLAELVKAYKFYQFLFFRQWRELRRYANERGVRIIGDIPIFVAFDSADVWINQSQFKLNDDGTPKVVSGVPPDYFSKTGQLWGNPIYNWEVMRDDDFGWWTSRFRQILKLADVVRVDHFRGLAAAWEVPGQDRTAENGRWVNVPGKEMFTAVKDKLGTLPVIAEDLGVITPDVDELRDELGFPGMRLLQYAFGGDAKNRDLPHNYVSNTAAYTGTHDNDTVMGWWASMARDGEKCGSLSPAQMHLLNYVDSDDTDLNWKMIRLLYSSVADIAVVPMQDVLGLGSDARMNTPATESGNWQWRFEKDAFTGNMIARLRDLAELYGRI